MGEEKKKSVVKRITFFKAVFLFWSKDLLLIYTRFSISCHEMAIKVFEVLSVAMTSSPEVVRIIKFSSFFFRSSDLLNSFLNRFTGLRFAWPNYHHPRPLSSLTIKVCSTIHNTFKIGTTN